MSYIDFIEKKTHHGANSGFTDFELPSWMFPFQQSLTKWAIEKGRAAIFADCGLGKTPMQLTWADQISRNANGKVLILCPLAVSAQTVTEAEKFGFSVKRSSDGVVGSENIIITNYERLENFNAADFKAVVCDESSILKSFDGTRRQQITEFMKKVPYRLLATATAAPNDYIELGTSSEALGYLGHMDMLNRFFKNDLNNSATKRFSGEAPKWRFKGHAELPFWRWVTSWARACRKPEDLGFIDSRFTLPELIERRHIVKAKTRANGMLFDLPAHGLDEQREERKRTVQERCEQAAELVNHKRPAIVWCHMNQEGDLLEELIPGSVQISGSDDDDEKEEKFAQFVSGAARVLVTKPKIGAWGLNFQHCSHVVYFPSHSYEQYYQAVRRCWRFGQKENVKVDIVMTEGEGAVMENLARKAVGADKMFSNLVREMTRSLTIEKINKFTTKQGIPTWL